MVSLFGSCEGSCARNAIASLRTIARIVVEAKSARAVRRFISLSNGMLPCVLNFVQVAGQASVDSTGRKRLKMRVLGIAVGRRWRRETLTCRQFPPSSRKGLPTHLAGGGDGAQHGAPLQTPGNAAMN